MSGDAHSGDRMTTMTAPPLPDQAAPTGAAPARGAGSDALDVKLRMEPVAAAAAPEDAHAEPAVDLRGVSFYYGAFRAVKDITFDVRPRRSPRSSARPAAASRRSCGRSTG